MGTHKQIKAIQHTKCKPRLNKTHSATLTWTSIRASIWVIVPKFCTISP